MTPVITTASEIAAGDAVIFGNTPVPVAAVGRSDRDTVTLVFEGRDTMIVLRSWRFAIVVGGAAS